MRWNLLNIVKLSSWDCVKFRAYTRATNWAKLGWERNLFLWYGDTQKGVWRLLAAMTAESWQRSKFPHHWLLRILRLFQKLTCYWTTLWILGWIIPESSWAEVFLFLVLLSWSFSRKKWILKAFREIYLQAFSKSPFKGLTPVFRNIFQNTIHWKNLNISKDQKLSRIFKSFWSNQVLAHS